MPMPKAYLDANQLLVLVDERLIGSIHSYNLGFRIVLADRVQAFWEQVLFLIQVQRNPEIWHSVPREKGERVYFNSLPQAYFIYSTMLYPTPTKFSVVGSYGVPNAARIVVTRIVWSTWM